MKQLLAVFCLIVAIASFWPQMACAEGKGRGMGRGQGMGQGMGTGGSGGFGPHHQLSAAEQKVFDTCLKEKNITLPQRPAPKPENKAAFEECRNKVSPGDRGAFHTCLKEKGIEMPAPPQQSDEQMAAIRECMKKAKTTAK